MAEKKTKDSQLKAQKKYDQKVKDRYIQTKINLNKETDADIIKRLSEVKSKQTYIKELIRADIRKEV